MTLLCAKLLQDRGFFINGLDHAVNTLHPKTIVVYGTAPDAIFGKYKNAVGLWKSSRDRVTRVLYLGR